MNMKMAPEQKKDMEHLHGHICDPGDPKCLG